MKAGYLINNIPIAKKWSHYYANETIKIILAWTRGLKLKVAGGPHETQSKVLRAALKKIKTRFFFNFEAKLTK